MNPETVSIVIDIVKAVGFSGIIFVIWVLTLKFFIQILAQQKAAFDEVLKEMSRRNEENFQVLNKFAEAIEFTGGQLSSIDGSIKNNRFCPIVRDEMSQPPVAKRP